MRKFYKIDPRLHIEKLEEVLEEPKIIRVNEFDEEALEQFEEDMDEAHATGQPVIPVVIDSFGGSVYGLFGMITAIETARVPVATVLTSKAMSAGAMLFCFGTEGYRFMHPHAVMMIHDAGSFSMGKVEEMKAEVHHVDEVNQSMFRRVSKHLGHEPGYMSKLVKENKHVDWFLSAKEAKKHNIANHLYIPKFEVEISLAMNFG